MPVQALQGTSFTAEDKLDRLRQQIHSEKFQDKNEIRRFVNRYVEANPDAVHEKSSSVVNQLVGNIRSELGLGVSDQPGITTVISDQVKDLVFGRAQASEDTDRWAVHRAANQVTMYSGQFVYEAEDIFIDGAGMDLLFRRIYKSQGFYNGPLGVNWDHNYNLWLREVDGNSKIAWLTGGLQESEFLRHASYGQAGFNYWMPPPGEHCVIFDIQSHAAGFNAKIPAGWPLQDRQACQYGLRWPDGTFHIYQRDASDPRLHYLRRIENRFGNYLEFQYGPTTRGIGKRIEKIFVNNRARVVTFKYDDADRIVCITDYTRDKHGNPRRWRYAYDDFGDLVAFTTPATDDYPSGLTEQYGYSTPNYTGELQHRLIQVYDTAGRLYLENEYGTDTGLLSFNRVIRQREGHGERCFEYEDVSLATGLPTGQPDLEEDMPAHQTVMVRRNGHPVHYIYNKFGNLIAREEDSWARGTRRRLSTQYRYNRDGALIGEVSPEGRITQYLYERDHLMRSPALRGLEEGQLLTRQELTWQRRIAFGNRLATVKRHRADVHLTLQFPPRLPDVLVAAPKDIVVKFRYEDPYQNISSISHPQHTTHANPSVQEDPKTLTRFEYDPSDRLLVKILYPDCTRDGNPELSNITERFVSYDDRGRLTQYEDQVGTRTTLEYFSANVDPVKEGYLRRQIIDPRDAQNNPDGLNLVTEYGVNAVGVVDRITTPKKQVVKFDVDAVNRVTKVTRWLKPGRPYETRYMYCRNMRVERIERDVQDAAGQLLWGGTEVQLFHYDENDNIAREQIGGLNVNEHLVTRHTYDDGDMRVKTTLPRGNAIRMDYDERRLPVNITRGSGSEEEVVETVVYDGDGLISEHQDGRGLLTKHKYDAFGRVIETLEHDENDSVYRRVRQDYDKAGNLTIERVFGQDYKLLSHTQYLYNEMNQQIEVRRRRFQVPIVYTATQVADSQDVVRLVPPPGTDERAVRTLYFFDAAGRLKKTEQHGKRLDSNGNPEANDTVLTSHYVYNSVGWLISEQDSLGNTTETRYDAHGLVTRVDVREKVPNQYSQTGEEVFTTLYKYDALDRLHSTTDGLGNKTQFEYDSRDAVVRRIDPLGNVIRFEYDVFGRQIAERIEMTDTGLGNGPRQPNSDIVTHYVYDTNGNLIRLIDAHNTPTYQVYDALDRRIELRYVDGTATKYQYDGNDNVVWIQDNNGLIKETTSFDPLDNPLEMTVDDSAVPTKWRPEGASYERFEYDALGQMTWAENDWADISFKIDSLGRIYEESTKFKIPNLSQTFTLKQNYDDFDFLGHLTYPNGRVITYYPDKLNRIKKIENRTYGTNYPGNTNLPPQRMILENTYRGLRIERKDFGNGASTAYAYDGAGRVISISHKDAQNNELLTIQHLYDAAGNMRFKREFAPNDNYGEVYKYDSRSQLTLFQEIQPSPTNADRLNLKTLAPATSILAGNQLKGQSQAINPLLGSIAQVYNQFTFKYDKLGNRLEERTPDYPQPIIYTPNNLNQYTQRNNTQYFYDLNGNLCQEKTGATARDYIYNHRNQIARVTEGANLSQFRYDALGRRIWSDSDGFQTYFIYDDENVIEEWRLAPQQSIDLFTQYVNELEIDGRSQIAAKSNEHYYHKDLVGSTRLLTDTNIQTFFYKFTPFGVWNLVFPIPSVPNSYLYAGRRFDQALESYYFRARNYSGKLGKFQQRDPTIEETGGNDRFLWEEQDEQLGLNYHRVRCYAPSLTRKASAYSLGVTEESNKYHYVKNNPLVYIDPEGLDIKEWIKILNYISKLIVGIPEDVPATEAKRPPIFKPKRPTPGASPPKGKPPVRPRRARIRQRNLPPKETGPRSQTSRPPPQTRARGGPSRGVAGFATLGMMRVLVLSQVYGYILKGYYEFFMAGTGLDVELRVRRGGFRISEEQWEEFIQISQEHRREKQQPRYEKRHKLFLEELAKKRGITIQQLKEEQQKERERRRYLEPRERTIKVP